MLIFTRNDDDFGDGPAALECLNGMRDHWFPRNCRKQFVKSHAPTASGRDDDGAKHEQKSETSNAQRSIQKKSVRP
jgi:hypothetical protein